MLVINTQGLTLCPLQKFKESLVLHTQLGGSDVSILGFSYQVISVAVGWNDTSEILEGVQEAQWGQGSGVRVKKWWRSVIPPHFPPHQGVTTPLKWWIPVVPAVGRDWWLFPAVFKELWSPAHTFLTVRDARHSAEAQECSAITDQAAPSALQVSSYLFSSTGLFTFPS